MIPLLYNAAYLTVQYRSTAQETLAACRGASSITSARGVRIDKESLRCAAELASPFRVLLAPQRVSPTRCDGARKAQPDTLAWGIFTGTYFIACSSRPSHWCGCHCCPSRRMSSVTAGEPREPMSGRIFVRRRPVVIFRCVD